MFAYAVCIFWIFSFYIHRFVIIQYILDVSFVSLTLALSQAANLRNLKICEVWICFNAWDPYSNTQRCQFMLGGWQKWGLTQELEVAIFTMDLFMIATCFFWGGLGWCDDRWYSSKGSEEEHHFTNNTNYRMLILMHCFYSIPTNQKKIVLQNMARKPVRSTSSR